MFRRDAQGHAASTAPMSRRSALHTEPVTPTGFVCTTSAHHKLALRGGRRRGVKAHLQPHAGDRAGVAAPQRRQARGLLRHQANQSKERVNVLHILCFLCPKPNTVQLAYSTLLFVPTEKADRKHFHTSRRVNGSSRVVSALRMAPYVSPRSTMGSSRRNLSRSCMASPARDIALRVICSCSANSINAFWC